MTVFLHSQSFCQESAERKSPRKYFLYFVLMSPPPDINKSIYFYNCVSKSVTLLIDFIRLLHSSMASNNFLAIEVGFSSSVMLLSRSLDIEFFSGPFAKRRMNAYNSDFIEAISKSLSKSDTLFGLLRKFSRGEYTVLLSSILLRSDLYKSLARLQLIALISFNPENSENRKKKFRDSKFVNLENPGISNFGISRLASLVWAYLPNMIRK